MLISLASVLIAVAVVGVWRWELVRSIYFIDAKTIILNGIIFLIFISGVGYLIRAYVHCRFEEGQVEAFIRDKENGEFSPASLLPATLIAQRYETIRELHQRRVPIHHGALAAIMAAEESLHQSYPRFVNNVLILTGVFGTIVSLIFALVGATSILGTADPGKGMEVMLLGMNTALTTTATAIVCFFLFTYFYHRLTDIQNYLFGRLEEAVLVHIVPEFAFDTEAIQYKTEQLIRELRRLVTELSNGADFIQQSLEGINRHNEATLQKTEAMIDKHDHQLDKTEALLMKLEKIRDVLVDGFRLNK
jgi:hypothetical protein